MLDSLRDGTIPVFEPHFTEVQVAVPLFEGRRPRIEVRPGLMTLVGPNGAGKTQVLRGLKINFVSLFGENKVRYLSAGRASPFERFRSKTDNPHNFEQNPAYVGHTNFQSDWFGFESLTGDYLALQQRADLRLKVQARLQTFLSRSIQLGWGQNGLEVSIVPLRGGGSYAINAEASGVLQIAPLLAAIYNDEISALLIDEPEISLHPQYQAFIMQEMQAVAGNPSEAGKKLVVIATHSPSMLPLRSTVDLPNMLFFSDQNTLPVQVDKDAIELKSRKLKALVARLTATHRLAFFAQNVLLVEGPSDEIIVAQLARALSHPLLPSNTQVVAVIGKSEFGEALKLFELMGKRVFILADLDALADSNALVNTFSVKPGADAVATTTGHKRLVELDKTIRTDFAEAVRKHWSAVESLATNHHYWTKCPLDGRSDCIRRRAVLAILMSSDGEELNQLSKSTDFTSLRDRFTVLFDALEKVGLFVLRRGTIEDYFGSTPAESDTKPEAAVNEAASFDERSDLDIRYADVIRAFRAAAPLHPVDENALLRERLGGALGAAFQFIEATMESAELNARAQVAQPDFDMFELENCSTANEHRIRVKVKSPLFPRDTFPFEISANENPAPVIMNKLPPP